MPKGSGPKPKKDTPRNLADKVYLKLKEQILAFELLPGDRFTETDVATDTETSRTPVRAALQRLSNEGYLQSHLRSGWQVKDFDFREFEDLYDLRIILEIAAVQRLCARDREPKELGELKDAWLIPAVRRSKDGQQVCEMDERFHIALVSTTGNREIIRIHTAVSERIRLIRRLDFTKPERITATYIEHAKITELVVDRQSDAACELLRQHIEHSKNEVRNISYHKFHEARTLRYERINRKQP